jgi:hypothetical protein
MAAPPNFWRVKRRWRFCFAYFFKIDPYTGDYFAGRGGIWCGRVALIRHWKAGFVDSTMTCPAYISCQLPMGDVHKRKLLY